MDEALLFRCVQWTLITLLVLNDPCNYSPQNMAIALLPRKAAWLIHMDLYPVLSSVVRFGNNALLHLRYPDL